MADPTFGYTQIASIVVGTLTTQAGSVLAYSDSNASPIFA